MIKDSTIAQIKKLPIDEPLLKMMKHYNVWSLAVLTEAQAQSFLAFELYLLNLRRNVTSRRRG